MNSDFVKVAIVGLALSGGAAAAQQPATPRFAGPRTLVGVVLDTLGNPVDSVEILVGSLKRHVMTGPDGAFRFDDVKPGSYEIAARRIGYYPQVRSAVVGDNGGVVSFSLAPGVRALPPVVTSVPLGGLSGVIGDTAYDIVVGAQVAVIASDHRTLSDSLGRFHVDLRPGKYMVQVSRDGYRSRLVSVTIPNDSGRRMTVWLTPSNRGQLARDAANLDALKLRLENRNPVWSSLFTREDINRLGIQEGAQLARLGVNSWQGSLSDQCQAIIDGGPGRVPLWAIDAADIEAMETYTPRRLNGGPTSINGNRRISTQAGATNNLGCPAGVFVYVWLRK